MPQKGKAKAAEQFGRSSRRGQPGIEMIGILRPSPWPSDEAAEVTVSRRPSAPRPRRAARPTLVHPTARRPPASPPAGRRPGPPLDTRTAGAQTTGSAPGAAPGAQSSPLLGHPRPAGDGHSPAAPPGHTPDAATNRTGRPQPRAPRGSGGGEVAWRPRKAGRGNSRPRSDASPSGPRPREPAAPLPADRADNTAPPASQRATGRHSSEHHVISLRDLSG